MYRIYLYKLLTLLLLLLFVWSCAAPPVAVSKSPKAEKGLEKSQQVKKKKNVKKTKKKPVSRKAPAPAVEAGNSDAEAGAGSSNDPDELIYGRMMFHYDYYPDTEVYFDTIRHLYFYHKEGKWVMSVALPASYRTDGPSFRLKLKTGQPYTLHEEHRRLYPATNESRF